MWWTRRRRQPPDGAVPCPFCGETVKARAPSCPHCGSDRETGWSEAAATGAGAGSPGPDEPARELGRRRALRRRRVVLLGFLLLLLLLGGILSLQLLGVLNGD